MATREPRLSSSNERSGGKLRTQVGPAAWVPIWVASVGLTDGEYRVYTSLRSFADQDGDGCFPSARKVAKRACVAYTTARNALQKFNKIGLVVVERVYRPDGSQTSNDYLLIDVCPPHLIAVVEENQAKWEADDEARTKAAKEAARAAKKAKDQVSATAEPAAPPTPRKVGGAYPTQGRAATPPKVGRANPGGVAITTPVATTPSIGGSDEGADAPSSSGPAAKSPSIPAQVGRGRGRDSSTTTTPKTRSRKAVVDGVTSVSGIAAEVRRIRPGWKPDVTEPIIQRMLDDGDPPELVSLIAQFCAANTSNLFPVVIPMQGEHWDSATARLDRLAEPEDGPAARRRDPIAECGRCDAHGWVLEPGSRTATLDPATRCDHSVMAGVS